MSFDASVSPPLRAAREWLIAGALACALALVLALALQHIWEMQPCPWCVLQRLVYLLIGIVCLAGVRLSSIAARLSCIGAGLLLCAGGLAAAMYQHLVAAKTEACGLTFADKLIMALNLHEIAPWMFVPYASCDRANLPLLGIPFALWSAALFILLGIALVMAGRALMASRRGLFG